MWMGLGWVGVWARAEGVIGVGFGWDEGYRLERREKRVLIWVPRQSSKRQFVHL